MEFNNSGDYYQGIPTSHLRLSLLTTCFLSSDHFLSFFKPRPTMDDFSPTAASLLFDPDSEMNTKRLPEFLYIFSTWALMRPLGSNQDDILSQFEVQTIMHNKIPGKKNPSNMSLIIETVDQWGKTRLFFLERTDKMVSSFVSDYLDKLDNSPAIDRFLEQNFVHSATWHGEIVRYFNPSNNVLFSMLALFILPSKSLWCTPFEIC